MSMKKRSLTTQNKLILIGLVISTFLIVSIAFFAIVKIQSRLDTSYSEFGKMLSKTLAIQSSDITKTQGQFNIYKKLYNNTKPILESNQDISYIEFKTNDEKIIYSSKADFPSRVNQTRITVSSPLVLTDPDVTKGNVSGSVVVGLSGHTINNISVTTRNSMLIVFTVAWIVFTIAMLINTMLITRELNMLQHGVKNISGGHFGYKLDSKGVSGEFKDLVDAFNDMSSRLHLYEEQNIEQLTLERNKFEAVLMSIANGVVVCDNYDSVVLINNAAQKILDVDPNLIISKKIQQYCDSNGELCFKDKIELFKDTPLDVMEKKPLEFNIQIDKRVIKALISPMFSKNQDYLGYIIILIDITKEFEIDKMKSAFISNVSHELRTPVTVLRTYADTLHNHADEFDEKTQKEFISILNQESNRLQNLVNDILDFSRLEAPNIALDKQQIDIVPLVESAVASLQVLADEKNISFSILKEQSLPEVYINANSIERAIKNLLSNAIKYSMENGKVKIRLEVSCDSKYLDVAVEDNGIGIAPEHLGKVFDRFYRVENSTHTIKGTGLGLHIVKTTVEKHHNGKVFVKSKVGQGSVFVIELPISDIDYGNIVKE